MPDFDEVCDEVSGMRSFGTSEKVTSAIAEGTLKRELHTHVFNVQSFYFRVFREFRGSNGCCQGQSSAIRSVQVSRSDGDLARRTRRLRCVPHDFISRPSVRAIRSTLGASFVASYIKCTFTG